MLGENVFLEGTVKGEKMTALPKDVNQKFILDATCAWRGMWFNKNHPNCLYIDNRVECNPDLVADFRNLDIPNESFYLIVWDPPHRTLTGVPKNHWMSKYGALNPETWQSDLKQGFSELWRILKPFGVLILKWSDDHISIKRIMPLFHEKPLFGQITKGTIKNRRKHEAKTFWFCFMKIPKEKKDYGFPKLPDSLLHHEEKRG